jgi:hypothetical protein
LPYETPRVELGKLPRFFAFLLDEFTLLFSFSEPPKAVSPSRGVLAPPFWRKEPPLPR